jgi:hypothetical protein
MAPVTTPEEMALKPCLVESLQAVEKDPPASLRSDRLAPFRVRARLDSKVTFQVHDHDKCGLASGPFLKSLESAFFNNLFTFDFNNHEESAELQSSRIDDAFDLTITEPVLYFTYCFDS